jgi:hypothetical protein
MHTKLAVTLLSAAAGAAITFGAVPAAQADVCVGDAWRHVGIGGCTNIVGDAVGATVAGAAVAGAVGIDAAAANADRWGWGAANYPVSEVPAFRGELPCISPSGLPYYTPGNAPCYP